MFHQSVLFCFPSSRLKKTVPKANQQSAENIRHSREIILQDIEKKLQLRDDIVQYSHQQVARFIVFGMKFDHKKTTKISQEKERKSMFIVSIHPCGVWILNLQ